MRNPDPDWWSTAVCYEIYPRSFADSNGDGIGDLPGITARLGYVRDLGFDAIWLTPVFTSPMADHGYDVADYRHVDGIFGSTADLEALIESGHRHGLRVLLDLVPNHTSDQHPWFTEALAAPPGSPARDRYLFRPCTDPDNPPNNWEAAFGGSAWSRSVGPDGEPGDWYLHLFAPGQPDLNWENPEVRQEFEDILRYWFDRGVDGLRIDVAHGLCKDPAFPDAEHEQHQDQHFNHLMPYYDREPVHDVYRSWRAIADEYPGRVLVGEVYLIDLDRQLRYVRPDELHQVFNFAFLEAPWSADALRHVIVQTLATSAEVGTAPTWLIGSHDAVRPVTRYGGGEVGDRRARAAALLLFALPGACYVFQGEELGLAEVHVPDDRLQDPTWEMSGHTNRGRDGVRVPLPWSGEESPFGFSSPGAAEPWLPMPVDFAAQTVARQDQEGESMLALYRAALALRHDRLTTAGPLAWVDAGPEVIAFVRGGVGCAVNFGPTDWHWPAHWEPFLTSGAPAAGFVPADTAAWFTVR